MRNGGGGKPRDLGLKSDSFHAGFDDRITKRVIAVVEGDQKTGKNHFCFTAPGPIVLFNFDCGVDGVIEPFTGKKDIIVAGVPGSGQKYPSYRFARPVPQAGEGRKSEGYLERVKKLATPIWERFISDMDEFYRSDARTGIIDTGGAAFALARFAFHGMDRGKPESKDDPYGQKSGDMKALFQGLITDGYSYDKNVLWIHRLKEKWVGNAPSGKFEPDGYKQVPFEVQMSLRTEKRRKDGENEFGVEITECRIDQSMEKEVFFGKECRFSFVMASVFGGDEDEWK
jgi:hypothetical protein